MAWATAQEVEDITGVEVSATQLAQAQAVVEIYAGRTPDADAAATARDLYWLKAAVCWQAAWLTEQVTYAARSTFQIQVQDGVHHHVGSPDELQLAPLAKRAIKNLSWFGNRAVTVQSVMACPDAPVSFLSEASDETHLWQPI